MSHFNDDMDPISNVVFDVGESLYPLFLKITNRSCLVVGGGEIAHQKARELLQSGALVEGIAPHFCEQMKLLEKERPALKLTHRKFIKNDCQHRYIVFSATADPIVDAEVFLAARKEGALVNVVDVKEQCDFYCGAQIRRGPVQILIGTQGTAPALAGWLRIFLEKHLPKEVGELATVLGQERSRILEHHPDFRRRATLLRSFVAKSMSRLSQEENDLSESNTSNESNVSNKGRASSTERIRMWLKKEVLSSGNQA